MTKLYSLFTPSHRVLKEHYFEPTLPQDVELHLRFLDHAGAGSIQDDSWRWAVLQKLDLILEAIEANWGEVFVFSDVDVQFFGSFADWIAPATAKHDLVFQIDAPGPFLCTGFFFCRANEATRNLWLRVRERVRETDAKEDDQFVMRRLIRTTPDLRWTWLPPMFFGGGTLTGKHWEPGSKLCLPRGLLLHHANFTCGVNNKVQQCDYVRELRATGPFMPLPEACVKMGVTHGFGYPLPDETFEHNHASRWEPKTDYEEILSRMALEPEFLPYAAEPETGEFLSALVKLLRPRAVLELGTHKGFTTVHLIRALADRPESRLVTIDREDQRSPQLQPLAAAYTFIKGHDLEVIPSIRDTFDFVFIDTTHRYEHTLAEIESLRRHSPGAVLALHDALSCHGVKQAIEQMAEHYNVTILPTPPHATLGWINGLALLSPKSRPDFGARHQSLSATEPAKV